MRKYVLGVLVMFLCLGALGVKPVQGFDTTNRITELKYSIGESTGKPTLDRNIIVWTEQIGRQIYPCYLNIYEGEKYILENNTNNAEPIQVGNGVLVYRTYHDNKLRVTNISQEVKFGIEPGDSIALPDLSVTGFYRVNEDGIMFLVGGNEKSFYWFTDKNNLPSKPLFIKSARNIHLSNYEGQNILLWPSNNKLFYCSLDDLDKIEILSLNNPNAINEDYIGTYGNQVVYFDTKDNLFIQEIASNSEPRKVPVNARRMWLYLIKDRIYYLDRDMNICFYDLNTLTNNPVVKLNNYPLSLASNGSDIVWKDYNLKLYWYAGLADLKLEGLLDVVEKGSHFQLNAVALYTNMQEEDISSSAKWYSSNNEVITVEKGWCQALASGTSIITAEYEGVSLSTPIVVKEVLGLEIISDKLELEVGDREQFRVYLVYSDDSRVDVTNEVTWFSELNEIVDGLYRADNFGTDRIKVIYAGLEANFIINVNDLEDNKPEEPEPEELDPRPDSDPKESDPGESDPEPESEPDPKPELKEPQPDSKPNQPRSKSKEISYNSIDDNRLGLKEVPIEKIQIGEGWYFDILRFCYRLFLPYPLNLEI